MLAQLGMEAVVSGSLVLLVALAFQAVFATTRVFHIAVAAVVSIGGYTLALLQSSLGIWGAAAVAGVVGALLGAGLELGLYRPLRRQGRDPQASLVASLAVWLSVSSGLALLFGAQTRVVVSGVEDMVWAGAGLTVSETVGMIIAGVVVTGWLLFLARSQVGLLFRAAVSDPSLAEALGHSVGRLQIWAAVASGLVAGLAGALSGVRHGADPHSSIQLVTLGIVAVLLGGRHRRWGAPLGVAVVMGVRALTAGVLSARLQDVAAYLVVAVVLLVRARRGSSA